MPRRRARTPFGPPRVPRSRRVDLQPARGEWPRAHLVEIAEVHLAALEPRPAQPRLAQPGMREGRLADARPGQVAFRQIALLHHRLEPVGTAGEDGGHGARLDAVSVEAALIFEPLQRHGRLVRSEIHRGTVTPKTFHLQPDELGFDRFRMLPYPFPWFPPRPILSAPPRSRSWPPHPHRPWRFHRSRAKWPRTSSARRSCGASTRTSSTSCRPATRSSTS